MMSTFPRLKSNTMDTVMIELDEGWICPVFRHETSLCCWFVVNLVLTYLLLPVVGIKCCYVNLWKKLP